MRSFEFSSKGNGLKLASTEQTQRREGDREGRGDLVGQLLSERGWEHSEKLNTTFGK